MIYVYFAIFVVASVSLTADVIMRYMEKIKSFSLEKKLFKIKGDTIPIEKFLPETLTMLFIYLIVTSVTGGLYEMMGMGWYLSIPCSLAGGALVCFFVQHFCRGVVDYIRGNRLPKGEAVANLDGYCTEYTEVSSCGKACLFYKDIEYEVNAANAGQSDISEGEKVIAIYESDGFYFVVRADEIYKDV